MWIQKETKTQKKIYQAISSQNDTQEYLQTQTIQMQIYSYVGGL